MPDEPRFSGLKPSAMELSEKKIASVDMSMFTHSLSETRTGQFISHSDAYGSCQGQLLERQPKNWASTLRS